MLCYYYRNTKRPIISAIREDGKLASKINKLLIKIKKLSKQLIKDIHNNASADTILRDTYAADNMHAVSEFDESIGSYKKNSILPLPPFVNEQLFRGLLFIGI